MNSEEQSSRARSRVQFALRKKAITKPSRCQSCGIQPPPRKLQAHHINYSKPMLVSWLCVKCHRRAHAVLELFRRTIAFHAWCISEGVHPLDAVKLPCVNPKTGRPRKITWYQDWRQRIWPRMRRQLRDLESQ